jgi:adenylosuccinate lyase
VTVPNVLADRYSSAEMLSIFDAENRVRIERQFWLAVLRAQTAAGLTLEAGVIEAYEAVLEDINLDSIRQRELVTRHDVKARLDEFCALAGHQHLHKGLTSRDATENVEGVLIWQALGLVHGRAVSVLGRLAELAAEYAATAIVGRTHNVAAQPTTVGKRMAQLGEELLAAVENIESIQQRFALRGIKGPVGSQQDQLDLLGSAQAVAAVEAEVADHLGIPRVLGAVGQVYPRSLDYSVVSGLVQLSAAPANLALLVRLMAGHDLATEGFAKGQVGSSAMPHKMNTRSCERISGLAVILKGHLTMAAGLSGDQWNEGDVSCSVVRRVLFPDAFLALDGLFETTHSVLKSFGVFEEVVGAELNKYLPFLATPTLLMHAVRNGAGREEAHEQIKTYAVQAALALRAGEGDGTLLIEMLGKDETFPGTNQELSEMIADPSALLGLVDNQIATFCEQAKAKVSEVGEAAAYRGADIL